MNISTNTLTDDAKTSTPLRFLKGALLFIKILKNSCILYICFVIIEKMKRGEKMKNYVEKANLITIANAFLIVALSSFVF